MAATTYWNPAIETLSPRDMEGLQLHKLKKQLEYNYHHSRLYKQKFDEIGMKPEHVKSLEDLRRIPLTDKDEQKRTQEASIEEFGHPYGPGTITCAPTEALVRINSTSGTTGTPTLYALTRNDVNVMNELHARRLWMVGIRPGHRVLQALSLSMFAGGLPLSQGIMHLGACAVPVGVDGGTKRVLDFITLTAPQALFTTPSFAQYLLEQCPRVIGKAARELGIQWLFPVGEPGAGNLELRRLLSEGFGGAHICDQTGGGHCFQGGECLEEPDVYSGMHFTSADHCILELVDPKTKEHVPLEDGASGEMVMTFLGWEGTPFMRYAYGDILEVSTAPCRCGRTSLRFKITGRADDLLIVKGMNVFPEAIKQEILRFSPRVTGFFRILLDRPGPLVTPPLKIRIEHGQGLSSEELAQLEEDLSKAFRDSLRVSPKFDWVPPDSIPRGTHKTKLIEIVHR
ncbi:MAG: AMP-binding protein [Deltaproteobacteria bacterium]|nr:AMP-binding protein [Deltaproteobacteria bacterium]